MGKKLALILFLVTTALGAEAQTVNAVNGSCTLGGQATVTQGMPSSGTRPLRGSVTLNGTGVMASYPGCTVTVFLTGTNTPAQIYSTTGGSALSNPFTANLTDGSFVFFAATGCYDITISSGATQASTMPNSKTFPGVCAGGGGGGGGNPTPSGGTSVTVNGTAAVPNVLNFSNVLLPPANGTIINFLLSGNNTGAYLPGNGNSGNCLSGTGTWVTCGGGGGGGATLPTTTQYDLFSSTGAGAAQASGVLGNSGFVRAQVYTATGDVTSASPGFQLFPNASVEYFPTGYANSQGNFGANNGLALYMSHSGQTSATGNGGIALGGGNSSGTGNLVYLDCETTGCDFKVPLTVNGSGVGGGGGATLPTTPLYDLFASNGSGAAQASGVLGNSGFMRAYVLEATGTGNPSPFTVPNGSVEYFPTGGYGIGNGTGLAIHFSHSAITNGVSPGWGNGGIALGGGNSTGANYQIYLDCESQPSLGCDFKVPVTQNGTALGGGGSPGVTSINSTTGAFTFTGPGVTCGSPATTCTFTGGGGGGSGTVGAGTAGHFTWYPSTGTTVGSNANLDDSVTTAATITSLETIAAPGLNVTGSGGLAMTGTGGNLPTISSGSGQGGLGIGAGGVPMYNSNGAGWTAIGSGGGSAGVSSINGTTGAFTFTGSGVSCATTTCTFSGGGTASNPILTSAGTTLSTPPSGQGSIGIGPGGVPSISVSGGSWLPIATNYAATSVPVSRTQAPACLVENGQTTGQSLNVPVTINAGVTVVVAIGSYFSAGNTFTAQDSNAVGYTSVSAYNSQIFILRSPIGAAQAATSVTVTETGSAKFVVCVATYTGVTNLGTPVNNTTGTANTTPTVSINASASGSVLFSVMTISASTAATYTPVTGTLLNPTVGCTTSCGQTSTTGPFPSMVACENVASAAGSLACTTTSSLSQTWSAVGVELIGGGGGTFAPQCPVTTDISFSTTAGTMCSRTFPAQAKAWIVKCAIPWNFTGGSGTSSVTVNLNQSPYAGPGTGMYWTTVLWSGGTPGFGNVQQTAAGATTLITANSLNPASGTIYTLILDGVAAVPSAGGTFSLTFAISGGTSPTGAVRSGAYCNFQ